MRDARHRLFDAAERVLLRDGPGGLTSRSVTAEAGVAKGVLHRHFADFDAFLAALVVDRTARLETQATALCDSAGTGTVAGNVTNALMDLFESVAVALVALVIARDGLRARLRQPGGGSIPVLTAAGAMLAAYLTAERDLGRIATDADIRTVAFTLIGAVHMLFTDPDGTTVQAQAVRKVVMTVIAGVVREPFA
jgi:AcrR family transcriptional regulator